MIRAIAVSLILLLIGVAGVGWGYAGATRDPIVREAEIALADWPAGEPSLRAVLISDIHVAGPDMPPERLSRIVAKINALRPDLVLIAGDMVSDKRAATRIYPGDEALVPLGELRARLGTIAVLGNHDHWRGAPEILDALRAAKVTVLDNDAIRVGPLVVGGLDDPFTHKEDIARTLAAMRSLRGAKLLLSHSPDPFPDLPPEIGLTLAGHTHCGQIALPLIGPLATFSAHGDRYACGLVREGSKTLIVGAGLGTSMLPLRIGAPPDLWLLTLGGRRPGA